MRNTTPGVHKPDFNLLLDGLEKKLKYHFRSRDLLVLALTHSSRANEEGRQGQDNEAMEFLGDSILSFVIADLLVATFPGLTVGELSRFRSRLVSEEGLARRARLLGLNRCLLLGKSERVGGGRRKPSLLADVYEAILAALYLDGGIESARDFVAREFRSSLRTLGKEALNRRDPKTTLQEILQGRGQGLPTYRLVSLKGPPHERRFTVSLDVEGRVVSRGSGRSKKAAEQQAASRALKRLDSLGGKECKERGRWGRTPQNN